jgi:ornithine cyclodeaminase
MYSRKKRARNLIMSLLILRAGQIRQLLTMPDCIEVMDRAMRAASAGIVDMPPRIVAQVGDGPDHFFLMPGVMQEPPAYGAKLISMLPGNPDSGRPAIQGFITLFDAETGTAVAILEGGEITRIRTAATSALASRELARDSARTHGIFGAGVQAAAHLEAIACVRRIDKVLVWARDFSKANHFSKTHSETDQYEICAVEHPAEAAACDIVSLVTNAARPILRGQWLKPGAHLNLVGAHETETREADSDAVSSASVYVDTRQGALSKAGDLLIPIRENRIKADDIRGEIGEVLMGAAGGRSNDQQITLFKSLGIVAQDLYAAEYVLRRARNRGVGQTVDFP